MADPLARIDPFTTWIGVLPAEGSVHIADWPDLGIATVIARGPLPTIGGLALPDGPGAMFGKGMTIVAAAPGTWLVLRDAAPARWIRSLESELGDDASVVDLSSTYAVLRLSGEDARRLLARGAFIDFHPDSFRPGSAAVTLIADMGAIVWQRDDAPTYEIAVFRSYAGSFWHWIEGAAAGFGARVARIG